MKSKKAEWLEDYIPYVNNPYCYNTFLEKRREYSLEEVIQMEKRPVYKTEYNDIYLKKTKLSKPFTYGRYTVLRSRGHSLEEIIKMKRQSFNRGGRPSLKLNNRQLAYLKEYVNILSTKNLARTLGVSGATILNYKKRLGL